MTLQISDISGTVSLHNGVEMPYLGFGVMNVQGLVDVIGWAIDEGYRLFDTATIYDNEVDLGAGLRRAGVARGDVFVTSKVWNTHQGYDTTLAAFDRSLERLGFDHLDLYLVHWPVAGSYLETWRALEKLYTDGRVRAIGVSNFLRHHLDDLLSYAEVTPMVNQLEFHPRLVQHSLLEFCSEVGIVYQAWSPLMGGRVPDLQEVVRIAAKYDKTPAQVVLRWDIQKGVATIPRSSRRHRIAENADLFDFELTDEDLSLIDSLDRGVRVGPDPDDFDLSHRIPPD